MQETTAEESIFGAERIGRVLLKIAPPVMLAQLIQALYNIVDSFFVGKYSTDALTAVTVIYPIQLIIVALAVGTGVGVNTFMAREYALREEQNARDTAGTGTVLAIISWALLEKRQRLPGGRRVYCHLGPGASCDPGRPGCLRQAL